MQEGTLQDSFYEPLKLAISVIFLAAFKMIPSLSTDKFDEFCLSHTHFLFSRSFLEPDSRSLLVCGCGEYQIYLQDIALANNRMQALGYCAVFFLLKT